MWLFDTKHKRKSFTLTSAILTGLILLMFYIGLSYMDPPIESGITVNFGMTEYGSGNIQPLEKIKTAPQPETKPKEVPPTSEEKKEEVLTDDKEDTPVIPPKKSTPKETKVEPKREEVKKPVEEKKPSKSTTDALSSILNGPKSDGNATGSEGNDNKAGDKGDPAGDPYASSYFGSPGSGSGGVGYGLNGRSLVSSSAFQQECPEQGRVVVQIEVNREGRVIKATPGVKGTTNNDPCLIEPARRTAMSFRWNVDSKAPERQIGFVVVNFKLGE